MSSRLLASSGIISPLAATTSGRDLHAGVESAGAGVLHIDGLVHDAAGHGAHRCERLAGAIFVVQHELDRAHRDDVVRRAVGRKVRPRTDRQQCHCQEEPPPRWSISSSCTNHLSPGGDVSEYRVSHALRPRAHAGNFVGSSFQSARGQRQRAAARARTEPGPTAPTGAARCAAPSGSKGWAIICRTRRKQLPKYRGRRPEWPLQPRRCGS